MGSVVTLAACFPGDGGFSFNSSRSLTWKISDSLELPDTTFLSERYSNPRRQMLEGRLSIPEGSLAAVGWRGSGVALVSSE